MRGLGPAMVTAVIGLALMSSWGAAESPVPRPIGPPLTSGVEYDRANAFLMRLYELASLPEQKPKVEALYEQNSCLPLPESYTRAQFCFALDTVTPLEGGLLQLQQRVAILIAERTKPALLPSWLVGNVPAETTTLVPASNSSLLLVPTSSGYLARGDCKRRSGGSWGTACGDTWFGSLLRGVFKLPSPKGFPDNPSCDCDHAIGQNLAATSGIRMASLGAGHWECVGPS